MLHSSLNYKRVVKFLIEPEEFVHVGHAKGLELGGADLPIIKVDGKPIIPGSSIKGCVRNEFTRVLTALPQAKLMSMFGYPKLLTDNVQEILKKYDSKEIANKIKEGMKDPNNATIGLLDLLFGSEVFASPTIFTDALPVEEKEEYTTIRYHVRIDIDKDVAMRGNLVEIEATNPDVKFEFRVIYNSLDYGVKDSPVDKAFDYLIKFLDGKEILIGGWKSRGYGLVKLIKKEDITLKVEDLLGVSNER